MIAWLPFTILSRVLYEHMFSYNLPMVEGYDRGRPYSKARYTRDIQPYLNGAADLDFIDLYRLDKLGLNFFSDRIKDNPMIFCSTKAGQPANSQLLVALRYLATLL